jgi:hypothetical protein
VTSAKSDARIRRDVDRTLSVGIVATSVKAGDPAPWCCAALIRAPDLEHEHRVASPLVT